MSYWFENIDKSMTLYRVNCGKINMFKHPDSLNGARVVNNGEVLLAISNRYINIDGMRMVECIDSNGAFGFVFTSDVDAL